jgi:hypothetical protein
MDKVLKMIKLGEFPRVVAGDVPQISMIIWYTWNKVKF